MALNPIFFPSDEELCSQKKQSLFWSQQAEEGVNFIAPCDTKKLEEFVSHNAAILEYGCGYGRVLNTLAQQGYQNLRGVDFSEKMIARGQKLYPDLNFQLIDGETIPYENRRFDCVILFSVLTCIIGDQDQRHLIAEIERVLKPNGMIYLNDYLLSKDAVSLKRYANAYAKYKQYGVFELEGKGVCRDHSLARISTLFENFEILWFADEDIPSICGKHAKPFQMIGRFRG